MEANLDLESMLRVRKNHFCLLAEEGEKAMGKRDAEEFPLGYEEKQLYCKGVRQLKQTAHGGCVFFLLWKYSKPAWA